MLLILLTETAMHILWIGLHEQFFYGIRKGNGFFLHHCTVQHILFHTLVSWIVMLFIQCWEESKYPNMLWRCVICPLIGLSAKEHTHFNLFMDCPQFCSLTFLLTVFCVTWHDTKPNKNAKLWNWIQGQDRLGFVQQWNLYESFVSGILNHVILKSCLPFCVQDS
jgi:hypothetical protein